MAAIARSRNDGRRLVGRRFRFAALLLFVILAAATPAHAQDQDQHFTMIIRGEGETGVAVARGPITGVGTFREVEEDVGLFAFPGGTLRVRGFFSEEDTDFDPRSCVGTFVTSGTWVVEEGTGRYAEATGGGELEGWVKFGTERTGEGCGDTERFAIAIFRLTGTVALAA